MSDFRYRVLTRRTLLRVGGGAIAAAAGAQILRSIPGVGSLARVAGSPAQVNLALIASDGWFSVPSAPGAFYPDPLAPSPLTTYGFGFLDVTELTPEQAQAQRNKIQSPAPMIWVDELDELRITLENVGMLIRPDLTDGHTIHYHGFRNATPIFDGVPEMSVAVPIGRQFTYFYRPRDPGTYMYHCHFEDVEHVSMGMTGIVFVRPAQDKTPLSPGERYVYNDGDGSTRFDREYGMFLSELWLAERYRGAHIQEHNWSDYDPDVWLLNGRSFPDTLEPNGLGPDIAGNPNAPALDPDTHPEYTGDLIPPPGRPDLQYQPVSSLVQANSGDRVLLRFVNLGYQQHAMVLAGIPMQVVGRDAVLLRGRDGTDATYDTDTIYIGPGESADAIFVAPTVSSPTTFLLYNRSYEYMHNPGLPGLGGQMTEIRISPAGTLPPQTLPQT